VVPSVNSDGFDAIAPTASLIKAPYFLSILLLLFIFITGHQLP